MTVEFNSIGMLICEAVHSEADMFNMSMADKSNFFHKKEVNSESMTIDKDQFFNFYFPRRIPLDEVGGLELINDKGFISIQETYKKVTARQFERIGYVYRYMTKEAQYYCVSTSTPPQEDKIFYHYGFHFDQDFTPQALIGDASIERAYSHPAFHLQVLHPHPRFSYPEVDVRTFLSEVRRVCFEKEGEEFIARKNAIYLVR